MRRIPELLAPVGGMEQLYAAVENGADAVYLGGKQFNARMNAGNFDQKQLEEAISYAHLRGVQVHLTMNTLLTDAELPEALEEAFCAFEAGVDALIIQDLGVADVIHKAIPELELHLSTQGTIYNAEGVRQAAKLGFSRVVLAREVSLRDVQKITAETDTEIELFVHGAMCICYSGQCHMSREIGGRSGNRGACAQPCRLSYELFSIDDKGREKTHSSGALLSPKDLCMLDYLPQIAEAGVASLKIEGRMKSPEYVAMVTSIYRKYLDLYLENGMYIVEESDRIYLNQVFNRGGFSTGYLLGNPGRTLMSGELSKHQGTFLGVVTKQDLQKKHLDILLKNPLAVGDGIEIRSTAKGNERLPGNVVTYLRKENQGVNCDGDSGDLVTAGYIAGACNPGDSVYKITDKKLMETIRKTYAGKSGQEQKHLRKRAVGAYVKGAASKPLTLSLWDLTSDTCVSLETEQCCEVAVHRALTEETVKAQMKKTGGTPFKICHWDIQLEEGLALPVSALNAIRRSGLEQLQAKVLAQNTHVLSQEEKNRRRKTIGIEFQKTEANAKKQKAKASVEAQKTETGVKAQPKISVYLHRADIDAVARAAKASIAVGSGKKQRITRLYVPYSLFLIENEENIDALAGSMEVLPYLPVITKGNHDKRIEENWDKLKKVAENRGICIGNLGWIKAFIEAGATVYGDYGMNVYNSRDFLQGSRMKLQGAILSHEFDGNGGRMDTHGLLCEVAVGGAMPLMISAHCPIGDLRENIENTVENCSLCRKEHYFLKDRKNENYMILSDIIDCSSMIISDKRGVDEKKMRWCMENQVDYMRIYGIDKRMFDENTLP